MSKRARVVATATATVAAAGAEGGIVGVGLIEGPLHDHSITEVARLSLGNMDMVLLSARSSSPVVAGCSLLAVLLHVSFSISPDAAVVSKMAAMPAGLSAKFGLSHGITELLNGSFVGFPDCAPYPYRNCAWPVPRPSEGEPISSPAACTRCAPRGRRSPSQIRVACVGDSITAGVEASAASSTYPSVLQSLLGDQYVVTNLGSSGATMQNDGYRPFVQTAMYRALLENTWDVVVLMLGA